MEKQSDNESENKEIDISELAGTKTEVIDLREPGSIPYTESHDQRTRKFAFYILIFAFVTAVIASEVYGFFKGNDKLITDILSLLERIMLLVLGYYFARKE